MVRGFGLTELQENVAAVDHRHSVLCRGAVYPKINKLYSVASSLSGFPADPFFVMLTRKLYMLCAGTGVFSCLVDCMWNVLECVYLKS